jgi:uncharacterized protein (TIGR02147 family)
MQSVFEFSSYKDYVLRRLETFPKKGHGQFRRIAQHLNIHPVAVTLVFKGDRELSSEQAADLCDYFGFTTIERDYFLLMVQKQRAGTHRLRLILKEQMRDLQERARQLKSRLPQERELTETEKSVFYSNWLYSGISLATSLPKLNSVESLAEHFDLPLSKINQIVEFLIRYGLVNEKHSQLSMGTQNTHLEASSPLVARHHSNWRLRGLAKMDAVEREELFFTGPMSLSKEMIETIRRDLVAFIDQTMKAVKDSPSEELACLNIDWFKF